MDEIFLRFPHVGIQIMDNLNDKDLQRCCYVSQSWNNFVKSEKFWWIRIIKRIVKELNQNYTDCPRIWRRIFKQITTETVKNFAKKIKVEHEMWETIYQDTPLHMVMRSHSFFKKTELITIVRNIHGTLDNESDKNQKNDARQNTAAYKCKEKILGSISRVKKAFCVQTISLYHLLQYT